MQPSAQIWRQAAAIRTAMLAMPFNRGLSDGSLDRAKFKHYMVQDALYLQGYARVLAIGAAKAPGPDEIIQFAQASQTAIVVERALHQGFLDQFGVSATDLAGAEMSPSCAAYVNFMLAESATGTFATLVGAILPCFWVYREIGVAIAAESQPDNFYQPWIDTYADPSFADATQAMIAVYDRAYATASDEERARMERAFLKCCQYEWMFWDAAWRQERWPV
jgi:thiaminase (transcriptional activator TenA)